MVLAAARIAGRAGHYPLKPVRLDCGSPEHAGSRFLHTGNRSAPDHAVLTMNMTKDQLKAAPEFKYAR